jgi:transcriptional regulator with XRE-family HTH domain
MPTLDRDGRTARQAVSRLLSRGIRDSEMAAALDVSLSTFSRRKDKPDFPNYDELRQISEYFGVDDTILLVDFGYVDVTSLNDQLRQRYAAYRNALDVIKSLRKSPNPGGGDSAQRADITPPRSKNIGAGCSNS